MVYFLTILVTMTETNGALNLRSYVGVVHRMILLFLS